MHRLTLRFATALSLTALALGVLAAGPRIAMAQQLTGAGSTFINPIMTQWIDTYKKATGVSINYQAIGSGGGINALINHTVNFAGSDAPMNAQEMAEAKAPVLHLPAVIGAGDVVRGVGRQKHRDAFQFADRAHARNRAERLEYAQQLLIRGVVGDEMPHVHIA